MTFGEPQTFPVIQVSRRDIPGETKDAQRDRIQQQSKIKVVKMLALVVILFVLSWLPLYSVFAIMKFGECLTEAAKCNERFCELKLSTINFLLRWCTRASDRRNSDHYYADCTVAGLV